VERRTVPGGSLPNGRRAKSRNVSIGIQVKRFGGDFFGANLFGSSHAEEVSQV
jgi:hypothetical protein